MLLNTQKENTMSLLKFNWIPQWKSIYIVVKAGDSFGVAIKNSFLAAIQVATLVKRTWKTLKGKSNVTSNEGIGWLESGLKSLDKCTPLDMFRFRNETVPTG